MRSFMDASVKWAEQAHSTEACKMVQLEQRIARTISRRRVGMNSDSRDCGTCEYKHMDTHPGEYPCRFCLYYHKEYHPCWKPVEDKETKPYQQGEQE